MQVALSGRAGAAVGQGIILRGGTAAHFCHPTQNSGSKQENEPK